MTHINIEIIDDFQGSIDTSSGLINQIIPEINYEMNRDGITIEQEITSFHTVEEFKEGANERKIDLIIADLAFSSSHDRSGWTIINEITQREIIPVLVYSAHAEDQVPEDNIYNNLFIIRQKKGDEDLDNYKRLLKHIITLKVNFIIEKDRINKEFGKISLETCKKIINAQEIHTIDKKILSSLAMSRLTSFLLNIPPREGDKILPESIFIYPPLEYPGISKQSLMLGDILQCKETTNMQGFWIVCSPSCDLLFDDTGTRKRKVSDILLLPCYCNPSEVRSLADKPLDSKKSSIKDSIKNKTSKLLKCPQSIFQSSFLLFCFKEYRTYSYDTLKSGIESGTWEKVASLATPYAESLQNTLIHDLSRIGTPDTISVSEEKEYIEVFLR